MEFFHLIKASQKSGKKDAVIWFTAKSVARANLQLDVALEEAGIEETGRGKDYAKPIRTDFPVYDDLPEEGAVDYTWCERYELQNDDRTWLPKVTAENSDEKTAQTVDSHITTESTLPETAGITLDEHDDDSTLYPVVQMPFRKQLLSQFTADELRHHVTHEEYEAIGALEMDTDNSYVQNLLLAAVNCPEVKGYDTKDLWRYTDAIRKVFSQDKRHELALVLRFTRMWAATDYIDRGILAREEGARRRAEEAAAQPQKVEQELVKNVGNGIFDVTALLQNSATHGTKKATETTSNVQVQETVSDEKQAGDEVQPGESSLESGEESDTSQKDDVNQNTDSVAKNSDSVSQTEPVAAQTEPEAQSDEPAVVYPAYFEPGRYEGLPNEVYHAANGISSTQVKDARVSLMYFNARHVEKTIVKERSAVLDMGNLVHALALQPELLDAEFSVEPVIPEGAFTTAATLRAFIDEHNASLPALLSADDIKVLLEEYNATLPPQVPLGANLEETAQNYMALPADFQRIDGDQKQTATAMKACIKEYNATLPPPVKTSGSRDALLEQLAIINPDLVAQEAQKPAPLKVSGTKADMIQAVKAVKPDAVFADELLDAWRDNPEGKVLVTRQQLSTALNIQKALLAHPTAGMLLTHPSRAVEVSYFGFDEETGLEVRVRPDLEIDLDGVRIGADLKTISMWNVKQESLRARLHREIIERDYHLSAAMYCETAALDQFFWIFVNKDENYHWIAIIEASAELLELGMLEYRKAMRNIATGFDTGEWPAPITADYTDELNDFDLRRLEALRTQA